MSHRKWRETKQQLIWLLHLALLLSISCATSHLAPQCSNKMAFFDWQNGKMVVMWRYMCHRMRVVTLFSDSHFPPVLKTAPKRGTDSEHSHLRQLPIWRLPTAPINDLVYCFRCALWDIYALKRKLRVRKFYIRFYVRRETGTRAAGKSTTSASS